MLRENHQSNQIRFISSKPEYKITQTKTMQLVSYGVRKVIKRH